MIAEESADSGHAARDSYDPSPRQPPRRRFAGHTSFRRWLKPGPSCPGNPAGRQLMGRARRTVLEQQQRRILLGHTSRIDDATGERRNPVDPPGEKCREHLKKPLRQGTRGPRRGTPPNAAAAPLPTDTVDAGACVETGHAQMHVREKCFCRERLSVLRALPAGGVLCRPCRPPLKVQGRRRGVSDPALGPRPRPRS